MISSFFGLVVVFDSLLILICSFSEAYRIVSDPPEIRGERMPISGGNFNKLMTSEAKVQWDLHIFGSFREAENGVYA